MDVTLKNYALLREMLHYNGGVRETKVWLRVRAFAWPTLNKTIKNEFASCYALEGIEYIVQVFDNWGDALVHQNQLYLKLTGADVPELVLNVAEWLELETAKELPGMELVLDVPRHTQLLANGDRHIEVGRDMPYWFYVVDHAAEEVVEATDNYERAIDLLGLFSL